MIPTDANALASDMFVSMILLLALMLVMVVLAIVNNRKLNGIHVIINSRLSELLDATKKASYSEGSIAGTKNDQAREKNS
jgi:hypothetical protein